MAGGGEAGPAAEEPPLTAVERAIAGVIADALDAGRLRCESAEDRAERERAAKHAANGHLADRARAAARRDELVAAERDARLAAAALLRSGTAGARAAIERWQGHDEVRQACLGASKLAARGQRGRRPARGAQAASPPPAPAPSPPAAEPVPAPAAASHAAEIASTVESFRRFGVAAADLPDERIAQMVEDLRAARAHGGAGAEAVRRVLLRPHHDRGPTWWSDAVDALAAAAAAASPPAAPAPAGDTGPDPAVELPRVRFLGAPSELRDVLKSLANAARHDASRPGAADAVRLLAVPPGERRAPWLGEARVVVERFRAALQAERDEATRLHAEVRAVAEDEDLGEVAAEARLWLQTSAFGGGDPLPSARRILEDARRQRACAVLDEAAA